LWLFFQTQRFDIRDPSLTRYCSNIFSQAYNNTLHGPICILITAGGSGSSHESYDKNKPSPEKHNAYIAEISAAHTMSTSRPAGRRQSNGSSILMRGAAVAALQHLDGEATTCGGGAAASQPNHCRRRGGGGSLGHSPSLSSAAVVLGD
jgi:hypothetical protein